MVYVPPTMPMRVSSSGCVSPTMEISLVEISVTRHSDSGLPSGVNGTSSYCAH
ncbi:Uncharacterised protein [Bordetella pertussis]|nr:Uncharacterised protein [Bordetella pertussis]CFO76492.1 Uncharacterised protein [Bordetella pertussis]CFU87763.1 Uncharacterised protein [Bordetella pertussis]CFW35760.1 Uncharacterised protein [Bordetella pertussis]CPI26563.1 Uncharacterised protein [Bordetella pertussis]